MRVAAARASAAAIGFAKRYTARSIAPCRAPASFTRARSSTERCVAALIAVTRIDEVDLYLTMTPA